MYCAYVVDYFVVSIDAPWYVYTRMDVYHADVVV